MDALIIGIVSSLIAMIIGYHLNEAIRYIKHSKPLLKTWQFKAKDEISVFIPDLVDVNAGVYKKMLQLWDKFTVLLIS